MRKAAVFDAFDMSRILIQSITRLCAADHEGDPEEIARWTSNKTPVDMLNWIRGDHRLWLALLRGVPAGVGAISPEGEISVLYVSPEGIGKGVGSALLSGLEEELKRSGHAVAALNSTKTAREFYLNRGWQPDGSPEAPTENRMIKPL